MQVGVGYSEHPDSTDAGLQAVREALNTTQRKDPCSAAFLFCTARHHQQLLRDAVASVVGACVPIYGGGAVGVITNRTFGYAGDQVGVALIWLDGVRCDVLVEGGLHESEKATGERLGLALKALDITPSSPMMLFYDAVDRSPDGVRLLMATWLLEGLEKGLGFLPALTGAGLQGDHICSPTAQFTGDALSTHTALMLAFSDDIVIDSAIMHGCRPASQYYTVTKADGPVILEINGEPAIPFMDKLLNSSIKPEEYPFFLLFGINHGDPWHEYDENNYASRLCLGLDTQRDGIVMFEPDMVAGTTFQLMYRSLDYEYMRPKIEAMFDQASDREPVFALYIDCAGRCAGYGGLALEDAVVVQHAVAGRVPLLGLYTGVEIAPIGGRSRGLDWTGVFCLFSKNKDGQQQARTPAAATAWHASVNIPDSPPPEALIKLSEHNAAKILALDTQSIAIRHELEQKRRGFHLLAELSVSLRQSASYESLFIPVAKRINAALNMQRTVVLVPSGTNGDFIPAVLHGYTPSEKLVIAGCTLDIDSQLLDHDKPVLVTGADDPERLQALRLALMLPYFIASPVIIKNEVAAILITGRVTEQPPFLSRLSHNDVETVQAISALLASVLVHQRLEAAEERAHIMLDAMPLCCVFWDEHGSQIDCNEAALRLFGLSDKDAFLEQFYMLSPQSQPDGRLSEQTLRSLVIGAFVAGRARFEWVFMTQTGEQMPSEVTLVRVPRGEDYTMTGYIRDLREQRQAIDEMRRARDLAEQNVRAKSEFLASISHEVRTPMNAILAMARMVNDLELSDSSRKIVEQGVRSTRLLTAAIDSILDYSRLESGSIELEEASFSIRDVATGICSMLAQDAAEKSLKLITHLSPDLPEAVIGDAGRLEQAVFNLVANAVKFTEQGHVTVSVRHEDIGLPGQVRIIFDVEDTGIGIAKAQQSQLFQPLTALDTAYSRKRNGLGMGLALSRSLALMMGGDITFSSVLNEGSIFSLSVILALPENADGASGAIAASYATALSGLRVLVAEDNVINQIIVEELLTTVGIDVVMAGNGLEALEALQRQHFDLVLMDIQMPQMDGLAAAAQIRTQPKYDDMPILAMTANAAPEHREESLKSGMNGHLNKPIDVDEVYAAIRHWCGRE